MRHALPYVTLIVAALGLWAASLSAGAPPIDPLPPCDLSPYDLPESRDCQVNSGDSQALAIHFGEEYPTWTATTAARTSVPPTATSSFTLTPTPSASSVAPLFSPTFTRSPSVSPTATRTLTPVPTATNTPTSGTRDKLLQPFASNSPWNTAIGSNAQYVSITIPHPDGLVAENNMVILSPSSPLRALQDNDAWPPSCASGSTVEQVPIPDGYIVTAPPSGGDGIYANRAGGVLRADGVTIREFQYATRCNGTGVLAAGAIRCTHSIYGSGLCGFAAHGGSGLSGVGGSLRLWEVTTGAVIQHALKMTVADNTLSNCNNGYRWPAVAADSGYQSAYTGPTCDMRMGSLVALPPSYNCGQHSGLAGRICVALQDRGAYVVDVHPGWQPVTIVAEWGTWTALDAADTALLAIIDNLDVVANNSSSNIGGGGTPRQPALPPIGN